MSLEEMIAENERSKAAHAAACARFERQAAHYRAITAAANAVVQTAIDQLNAPWFALIEELKGSHHGE